MRPITQQEIVDYVEANIQTFHRRRLDKLQDLKLMNVVKRKNPYLFKAKNINAASEFVKTILDAFLSSQEEGIFGDFLEELAIFICGQVYDGRKSSAVGIDLEFEKDDIRYIISIKSGPNWGNSSQITKMLDNFRQAKRILGTSTSLTNVVAVNGCCYGKDRRPNKGDYFNFVVKNFGNSSREMGTYTPTSLSPLVIKQKRRTNSLVWSMPKSSTNLRANSSQNFAMLTATSNGKILSS